MKINKRLQDCIAGYEFYTNRGRFMIGMHNAELLIQWLEQCKFKIIDKKAAKE